jgi:hypothetical protein
MIARSVTVLLLFFISFACGAQSGKRIQPGKVYEAGEALYAPRFGFRASVPTGWIGVLPRQSEVFLLTSYTSPAEVFVLARESATIDQLKKEWDLGFEMNNQIRLTAKGSTVTNNTLSAEVVAVGDYINKSMRGYAVARCSDGGSCVTALAVMPTPQFEEIKKLVDAFMAAATFEAPSFASPYADFVWKDFLTSKMVTTYSYLVDGSKESTVHLCADGSFTAKVTKKGILKNQNPDYKGKLAGKWTVEGIGERGKLSLTFDKGLSPLNVELTIKEEQIFAGGERYFVANSDTCK